VISVTGLQSYRPGIDTVAKIIIVGTSGYEQQSADSRVECCEWGRISRLANLRDYDVIILDLLSVNLKKADWAAFRKLLNPTIAKEILFSQAMVITVGDPRFQIPVATSRGAEVTEPFLNWTGLVFGWDNSPGDTVLFNDDYNHHTYAGYVRNLRGWSYSLRSCTKDVGVFQNLYSQEVLRTQGRNLRLEQDPFCANRYGNSICFSVRISVTRIVDHLGIPQEEVLMRSGTLVFLPEIDLDHDQTILLVLRDVCGIESDLPEPDWVEKFEAPGQKQVDEEIRRIEGELVSNRKALEAAQAKREHERSCLKLLYGRGTSLEEGVREVLRVLGAQVEDPTEAGKEDGWVTVHVSGKTFEGVLEVKSTKNDQFGEDAIRQLLDWVHRGVQLRQKKYKGICIGSSAVDKPLAERPWAFSDSWEKSAELHEFVALKSEDLYQLHLLNAAGNLDRGEFWGKLFNTNGILDLRKYHNLPPARAK
jgi:hypothetical protein